MPRRARLPDETLTYCLEDKKFYTIGDLTKEYSTKSTKKAAKEFRSHLCQGAFHSRMFKKTFVIPGNTYKRHCYILRKDGQKPKAFFSRDEVAAHFDILPRRVGALFNHEHSWGILQRGWFFYQVGEKGLEKQYVTINKITRTGRPSKPVKIDGVLYPSIADWANLQTDDPKKIVSLELCVGTNLADGYKTYKGHVIEYA
jgi:hypothetical protein